MIAASDALMQSTSVDQVQARWVEWVFTACSHSYVIMIREFYQQHQISLILIDQTDQA